MAVLTTEQRADVQERFIRNWFVEQAQLADLDSVEIGQLIADVDAWLDTQTAEANTAIRAAIRTKASTSTKFVALAWVALKRSGSLG